MRIFRVLISGSLSLSLKMASIFTIDTIELTNDTIYSYNQYQFSDILNELEYLDLVKKMVRDYCLVCQRRASSSTRFYIMSFLIGLCLLIYGLVLHFTASEIGLYIWIVGILIWLMALICGCRCITSEKTELDNLIINFNKRCKTKRTLLF